MTANPEVIGRDGVPIFESDGLVGSQGREETSGSALISVPKLALTAYFLGLPAAFRFAAQYAFIRTPCALRWAELMVRRLRFTGTAIGAGAATAASFGGLPRRLAGPPRTSMARFSLSRSAMSRARM